mmetsp:Transcript_15189/g.44457  ORF Transcript_15189/g.44457 Transcript_15189/m.44457 type:complete len:223 (+) Transcript_15189:76-744(+)
MASVAFPGEHHHAKVVLLGEGRVGKTSLLIRFVHNTFDELTNPTVQASYFDKRIALGDATLKLALWDTAGQERFHALGPIYYRDADAALLIFDLSDAESFAKVKHWVKELRRMVGREIDLCIVGNKVDMERARQVDRAEAEQYAEQVGALYGETSAKRNVGIDEIFMLLATRVLEKKRKELVDAGGGALGPGNAASIIVDTTPIGHARNMHSGDKPRGGSCC